jgi:hypothetical protein
MINHSMSWLVVAMVIRLDSECLIKLTSNQLHARANDACSDDTCRIKIAIADWLNGRTPLNPEAPKITLSNRVKEDRGYPNDITGGLLCPIDYDWDDPEYVQGNSFHLDITLFLI